MLSSTSDSTYLVCATTPAGFNQSFYTPPHDSGGVLWFHIGRPSVMVRLSVHISFPDDNLSKHQWIFTKFGICIDIVEIWFGIAINGQISSNLTELFAQDTPIFSRVNIEGFQPNLVHALI